MTSNSGIQTAVSAGFSRLTTALNSEAAEELPILQKLEMKKSFAENDRIAAEIYPKYYERGSDGKYFLPKYEPHPILQCREEILQKYEQNKVLVITGETGSGKSTQVPQYILDDSVLKKFPTICFDGARA